MRSSTGRPDSLRADGDAARIAQRATIDNVIDRLARRGNLLLFWTQQSQLLARLTELARAVSADMPGLRMEMRYTAVPSELSTEPGANALFDDAWMHRLEKLGYERAQNDSPWDQLTSPYERPIQMAPREPGQ